MGVRPAFSLIDGEDLAFRAGGQIGAVSTRRDPSDEFRPGGAAIEAARARAGSPVGQDPSFPTVIDLADLDGSNGFRIDGIDPDDRSGRAVASAGDVNGDGFNDVIIGAHYADPNGDLSAGESYVVFGSDAGFAVAIELADLDGTNGFRLDGIAASDLSGSSVASAGDVNGDGFDDIIIGARFADGNDDDSGESYVVFGSGAGFAAAIDLAGLDGSNGFRMDGVAFEDRSGGSVASAGDVNGDGFDDVIVGADDADPNGDSNAGASYVVFGSGAGFAAGIDLASLDGTNGFRLDGIDPGDSSGEWVSSAGDINGDGFDDLIVGAPLADLATQDEGESYVVFGSGAGFAAAIDLASLDGSNGFRIHGIDFIELSGGSVSSAGDVNADGFDDIIIGSDNFGESYVVFGSGTGFAASIDLASLDGANGFRIDAAGPRSVSSAGDVNGDGFDDVIVGNPFVDPGGDGDAGQSYVVFGKAGGFAASIDRASLDGANGLRIDGIDPSDRSGGSVSAAGDVNGDGFDDLIVGAYGADPDGDLSAGESYVVFGRAPTGDVTRVGSAIGQTIWGGSGDDSLLGQGGDDLLRGQAGEDYLLGGDGNDTAEGGAKDDSLLGGDGNDLLIGGAAGDLIAGGKGTDTANYAASEASVTVDLQSGAGVGGDAAGDVLTAIERITGSKMGDALSGDALANLLRGGKGNDALNGRDGADSLIGEAGDDTLAGGAGADVLIGGAGADRFVLGSTLAADTDRLDFAAGDQIALLASAYGLPPGALAPNAFRNGTSAQDANDRIIYKASTGKLWFDADGDGAGAQVLIATLNGAPVLSAGDFVVI